MTPQDCLRVCEVTEECATLFQENSRQIDVSPAVILTG
jgi:hypothetical protein